MNEILSIIGSCTIVILITYIIKKVNEYLCLKEEKQSYKIDEDDDDDL